MSYSQFGEDKIIDSALEGYTGPRFFVEIGCLADYKFSNVRHLEDRGWKGVYLDKDEHNGVTQAFITSKNVNDVLDSMNVPKDVGVLSLDIDGNDYHVLNALAYTPYVLVVEYNSHRTGVMPENDEYVWRNDNLFGASKEAMLELCSRKGYSLYGETRSNLILCRNQ